ncbi:uncharacterized protein H6S33_008555, partial [Morchella sextelata]|uniref:uncharacterized protein n=1 Tax=Morchella sextelata TaxID=1174677 RepID=UPI001D0383FC
GVIIEMIPEEGFCEDDKVLAADLAAFMQNEVINAQLCGIDTEDEEKKEEEKSELPVVGDYERAGEHDL